MKLKSTTLLERIKNFVKYNLFSLGNVAIGNVVKDFVPTLPIYTCISVTLWSYISFWRRLMQLE
jgi:hypothetical protein